MSTSSRHSRATDFSPPREGIAPSYPDPRATPPRQPESWKITLLIALVFVTNFLVIHGSPLPWIGAVGGFLLAIGLPAWMLSQKIDWRTDAPSERLAYSVISAIFGLMVVGLVVNTVLPFVGIARPLDRGPVLITVDVWCGLLALWRRERFRPTIPPLRTDRLHGVDWAVGLLSALCVPLAIMGANRLNNGAGSGVTLTMLFLAAITIALLFARRDALNAGTITASFYFIALAMLLMTSLRGWYITGHDIQNEYAVFEVTKNSGDWNISQNTGAYNACLSLTILPTMLWQVLRVDDPYIFKFWFQLLFALVPVLVYRISRRHTNSAIAVIATIYFIAFPTYFTDMPFLNRQEIAYLFVGACILTATDPNLSHKTGRLRVAIFSTGVVLSHYSTAYVFVGTLAVSWVVYKLLAAIRRDKGTVREEVSARRGRAIINPTVSIVNVLLLLAGIGLWNGLATHTASNLTTVAGQALQSLRGGGDSDKSTDTSYSVLGGGGAQSPDQILSEYAQSTVMQTDAQRTASGLFSKSLLNKYYPITAEPESSLPVTPLGQLIDKTGLSVATLNSAIRAGSARLLQLFVALGLISAFWSWRKRPTRWMTQLIALSCGAIAIVALQVVVPSISADYGVLRAFQQAMLVSGPLVAVGSYTIFGFIRTRWSRRAAFFLAFVFFASLVGAIPQSLGGYPAQLNLNNSGQYYDLYYTHPQDITAIEWLQSNISGQVGTPTQPTVQIDGYAFNELQTYTNLSLDYNDFPTFLQRDSYVFLGYQTVTTSEETVFQSGDLISYDYPMKLLNSAYNLVYSNNGAAIYG
jgi:uncharacterized membrane protein